MIPCLLHLDPSLSTLQHPLNLCRQDGALTDRRLETYKKGYIFLCCHVAERAFSCSY